MEGVSVLYKSIGLARRGKHSKAVSLLLPQVFNYRDNWTFYYTLALACLHTGDAGEAREYIKSAHRLNSEEPLITLLLAALNVRRGDTRRAAQYYLQTLKTDPKNKLAERGLDVIKKYGASGRLSEWVEAGNLKKLYPPFPKGHSHAGRFAAAALIFLAVSGGIFFAYKTGRLPRLFPISRIDRPGYAESALSKDDKEKAVALEGAWQWTLTESEVLAAYEKARSLFNEGRDDAARVEINRILGSTASEKIKNKARRLSGQLEPSAFDAVKDRFSYSQVAREPALYSGCTVQWKGMAADIVYDGRGVSFNLLAGYDTRRTLEGTVRVKFDKALEINTETPLEVLGAVLPAGAPPGFVLNGIAVQQKALP
ncbi:MAG: hypothetical protein LBG72_02195 [Spirochaetaceae bacterium]|nr:hypothetical protein [Spirochaetaceae bacterium]